MLALLELPYSEIASLLGIVCTICSVLGGLAMLWLANKFVKKSAYYHDKDTRQKSEEDRERRIVAIEQTQALAREPMTTMQKSVEAMRTELKTLTDTIGSMKDSVGNAIHELDKRTIVLEKTSSPNRRRPRTSAGR